jgi:tetratricopeptide (TPR) repeat protein
MVDLKPALPSYSRAAHLMWLAGDVGGALETARLAIQSGGDPEARAWVMVDTALKFWRQGDHEGADAGLDAALTVVPGYAPALAGKGRVALARSDYPAAARWLERAFARAPLAETAWLLGEARQALGDREGARQAYAHVLRFAPRGGR